MKEFEPEIEKKLKKGDLVMTVHKAKRRSTILLEEQGISALALFISKALIDAVEHPEKIGIPD